MHVYDRIVSAGKRFGLRHAGLKALGSLRMEKGYRDYGHDLDNLDTLLEAPLDFTPTYFVFIPPLTPSHFHDSGRARLHCGLR